MPRPAEEQGEKQYDGQRRGSQREVGAVRSRGRRPDDDHSATRCRGRWHPRVEVDSRKLRHSRLDRHCDSDLFISSLAGSSPPAPEMT